MDYFLHSFKGKGTYIIISIILFLIGALLGYIVFLQNPKFIFDNIDKFFGDILKIADKMQNKSSLYSMSIIFQNNTKALLLIIFGGVFIGLIPFASLIFNGFVVGVVLAMNVYKGQSVSFFVAAVIPHGIFELPVIFLGGAFGLKIGLDMIISKSGTKIKKLKANLYDSVIALGILIPVLFLAAAIEAIVTPHIARIFL